jgi:hypothetical protein
MLIIIHILVVTTVMGLHVKLISHVYYEIKSSSNMSVHMCWTTAHFPPLFLFPPLSLREFECFSGLLPSLRLVHSRCSHSGLASVGAFMPSSWSGSQDLCDQISVVEFFLIVLLLLWLELDMARRSTAPSNNLVVTGSSVVCGWCVVIPLLADHGGEEVRRYDEVWSMTMLHSACLGSEGEKQSRLI